MRPLFYILPVSLLLTACKKNNERSETGQLNGAYTGIFHRTDMDTTTVTLTFSDHRFAGTSDLPKYPAICSGSFEQPKNNSIHFTDSCVWTADFNWALILNGTYNFSQDEETIRITRSNGTVTDEYVLRRVEKAVGF